MPKWEYLTIIVEAEHVKGETPEIVQLKLNDPRLILPKLNELGLQGWDLISVFPYQFGAHNNIILVNHIGVSTNKYLCFFKRELPAPTISPTASTNSNS